MEKILKKIEELENLLQISTLKGKDFFKIEDAANYLDISKSHRYKLTSR